MLMECATYGTWTNAAEGEKKFDSEEETEDIFFVKAEVGHPN
jgi:hypothetical protein